jgi:phytanoyl-CoA hydroxylase
MAAPLGAVQTQARLLTRSNNMLAPDQVASYHREGYLVLPGFKAAAEVASLIERARSIVDMFDPGEHRAVFSSVEPERLADAALIASADQVHCFFEEEAFDAEGRLRQAKALAINKIGHALHDRDPVFDRFSRDARLAEICAEIGIERPQLWQSMVIFKQPRIGGAVRWHQDATYLDTEPTSVTGFWFALEDATRDNGCLWVQPGGHRGPLRERFIRSGEALRLERLDSTPWPDEASGVPVEVPSGTLVMFHGLMPHASAPNRSERSRIAYTLHVTDGCAAYSPRNWLQRGAGFAVRGF